MPYPTGSTPEVTTVDEYVLGPDGIPFFTTRWFPANEEPKAYVVFVHGMSDALSPLTLPIWHYVAVVRTSCSFSGFSEHITRYHTFFRRLAAAPSSLHILAFDQRGHGRTSHDPLTADAPEVQQWRAEGKQVKLEKNARRQTGGWPKAMLDIEWFVQRESERASGKGKKLFLHGFSMVSFPMRGLTCNIAWRVAALCDMTSGLMYRAEERS